MPWAFHQLRPVLATPPKQTGKLSRERCYCLRVRTEGYGKALAHRVLASRQPDVWKDMEVAGPAVQAAIASGARGVYFPKTEYESQKLLAEAGAATEILGAFVYPLGKIPADRPIFENRNSRIALVYGASVYHANHKLHILDVRGSESKTVGNDALQWPGSRARMDLYTSDAAQPQRGSLQQ